MKMSTDDASLSTQFKNLTIHSPAESSRHAQMSAASSAPRLTTTDALSYLKVVKERFRDKENTYKEFLDTMKDFKNQRISTSGVVAKVKELFREHKDLLLGFNAFLPKGFQTFTPPEDEPLLEKCKVDFEEAIDFIRKLKARFEGNDHVDKYNAFLNILYTYRKGSMSLKEVYDEVSILLQDHADLLVEFTHFLPDPSRAGSVNCAQPPKNHNLSTPAACGQAVDCPDDNLDLIMKSADRDDSVTDQFHQARMSAASSAPRLTTKDALSYLRVVKERFRDKGNKFQDFIDIMKDFKAQRINKSGVVEKVKELFREDKDLLLGFYAFLPKGYVTVTLPEDYDEAIADTGRLFNNLNLESKLSLRLRIAGWVSSIIRTVTKRNASRGFNPFW